MITLEDLSEPIPIEDTPPMDDPLAWGATSPELAEWIDTGVMHLRGLLDHDVIDAYCERFKRDAYERKQLRPLIQDPYGTGAELYELEIATGYGIGTPYLINPEMRDLCLDKNLVGYLQAIHNEPMGLHLNLTGWKSTQRAWHQDAYLNPPYVGHWYAAVWIALDDIHPDAGPFEYVPGSHRWPSIARGKMLEALSEDGSDPDWPWHSEKLLGPLFDREIVNRGAHVERFIAKKGDVLIWHPNLCHRGSVPHDGSRERRALIAHYSVISRRRDMPRVRRWQNDVADGQFFELGAWA